MRRWVFGFAMFLGAMLSSLPGVFLYMLNEPAPSISYFRGIADSFVPAGGKVTVHVFATISKHCPAQVDRFIVDANNVQTAFAPMIKNQSEDFSYDVAIPATAAVGKAKLLVVAHWKCNFVQDMFPMVVAQPPLEFEIGPSLP